MEKILQWHFVDLDLHFWHAKLNNLPAGFAAGFLTDAPAFTDLPATGLAVGFEEGLLGVTFFGGIMNELLT